jgi:ubiquinone/menaquinone biosynthesis C-methylase UbiE
MKHRTSLGNMNIGTDTLLTLTNAVNNNNWTYGKMKPFLGKDILEIGSGIGTFSKFIISNGGTVTLSDLNTNYVNDLKEKYRDNPFVTVLQADAGKIDEAVAEKKFDTVVAVNIIEHLENDDEAFERIKRVLLPRGRLIFIVPAHKLLFSQFDKSIGHFRRYRKSELERSLVEKGYLIEYIEFMNAISACGWFFSFSLLKRVKMPTFQVGVADKLIPFISFFEKRCKVPFGLSIFCVAKMDY